MTSVSTPSSAEDHACRAVAMLYHAWFTGLILMVGSREGPVVVGEWVRRTFRRQHEAKFLGSFEKLGLAGLPHAVACARYHYLSNRIGGVEVEYMPESDTKAWVRFPHPRWIYDGTAVCGVPETVSHGFLRGWYAQNGPTLGNDRLGFVCTSQDMTAEYGFSGYFVEADHPLAESERLRFRSDEAPPPFDPRLAPELDAAIWTPARLTKANRNYAMDYVTNGVTELLALLGERGREHARLAARLIGRQYHRRLLGTLGIDAPGHAGFVSFLEAMGVGEGTQPTVSDQGTIVTWPVARVLAAIRGNAEAAFDVWSGLWEGCLSTHDRFSTLTATRTDEGVRFHVRAR